MGTTFAKYKGNGFNANDRVMQVVLALIVEEMDKQPAPDEWQSALRKDWYVSATVYLGYVVLRLDKWVDTPDRRTKIVHWVRGAQERLREYGPFVPKDELNRFVPPDDGWFTADLDTERFTIVTDYLIKLLDGRLLPAERDSRIWIQRSPDTPTDGTPEPDNNQ